MGESNGRKKRGARKYPPGAGASKTLVTTGGYQQTTTDTQQTSGGIHGDKRNVVYTALDTNTLMRDFLAMYGFKYATNNIFIPLTVLLELDHNKRAKGKSDPEQEKATNARKAARVLLYLAESVPTHKIKDGIPLLKPGEKIPHGRTRQKFLKERGLLFFEMPEEGEIEKFLDPEIPDHKILLSCLKLKKSLLKDDARLVSDDTIMRILGLLVGLKTEKYENKALSDDSFRVTGIHYFPLEVLENHKGGMPRPIPYQDGRKEYVFKSKLFHPVVMNEFLLFGAPNDPETGEQPLPEEQRQYVVLEKVNQSTVRVRELKDFQYQHEVFFLHARNAEQNCIANAIVEFRTPLVIGEGEAGTGKTFWVLACAYELIKRGVFPNVILTRDAVDSGEKIGYLPGGKEAKVGNYLPGVLNAKQKLLALLQDAIRAKRREDMKKWRESQEQLPVQEAKEGGGKISRSQRRRGAKKAKRNRKNSQGCYVTTPEVQKLEALGTLLQGDGTVFEATNLMRGANIDTMLIVDESQHTNTKAGKMFASRIEEGGQIVLIGNIEQDDIGIPFRDSGVAKLIEATRGTDLMCLVTFSHVGRSRLAARIAQYYDKKKSVMPVIG